MNETLTIVARIETNPSAANALEKEMRVLVEDTRKEMGCIQYDLYRSTEQPQVFVFVEAWQSKALWEAHMRGEGIRAFNERIGAGTIAHGKILQLRQVV
jgi:quinol monooxygenase YgiN